MCGICGIVSLNEEQPAGDEGLLRRMNGTLAHRGPDDTGYYLNRQVGIGVSRLRIIDLAGGDQPIGNEDQSVWIAFNGEIYNHLELRRRLEQKGHVFKTKSDTEAILHAYEAYGDDCVHHLNGMFGFAIWDEKRRRLLLARDRLGIKPVFYCTAADTFIFASELKAILAHPEAPGDIDLVALDHFLTLEYIPSPRTIFRDIYKLPPGHRLIVEGGQSRVEQYWDVPVRPITADEATCVETLTELIGDAVKIRLMADVPLGAFLSGGIDSSTVVAFMSEASAVPVRTFSVGFGDPTYNELPYARLVADAFGTRHHEEFLEPDITDLVLRLAGHFDEPFGDFSIFPTYLVSQVARQFVTVVLSGDGGDELFAGYDTYVAQHLANRYYDRLPGFVRRGVLPRLMELAPPQPGKKGAINKAKRFSDGGALPPSLKHTRWMIFTQDGDKAHLYRPPLRAALNGDTAAELMAHYFKQAAQMEGLAQQQYVDVKTYLADDILAKVDRMSMAVSLEARVPLLDHRIVEFALNLPPHLKLNGRETKVILRRAMAGRLPAEILAKPKEGFSIPLKHWLRGTLRPLMTDLLAPDTVRRRGYFAPECVARWVSEHLAQKANHSHRLWALMVFELWQRKIKD